MDTTRYYATMPSPIGELMLISDGVAMTGLYMQNDKHAARRAIAVREDAKLSAPLEQLRAYFAGKLQRFDLPIKAEGTPFQQRVWAALCDIPYGETISYGELARRIGQPTASRAVGLANGQNPISIIVPCHRVIGADGTLTGYGGGLERKRWLLTHEGADSASLSQHQLGFRLAARPE
ncbi:MAG TPA: methylated-DNA--[protein]-cysteine S-methyltransferase [Burkholderiales bacterium]|nr:methylated-DNA--[protein]-cysteine S-methyltransferase [Burkholderiales bacterium]